MMITCYQKTWFLRNKEFKTDIIAKVDEKGAYNNKDQALRNTFDLIKKGHWILNKLISKHLCLALLTTIILTTVVNCS